MAALLFVLFAVLIASAMAFQPARLGRGIRILHCNIILQNRSMLDFIETIQ
jgi:hypothetical protein